MNRSHHNTTDASGSQLTMLEAKAKTQEETILDWFCKRGAGIAWAPSEVHGSVLPGSPITSVRRAMSNLSRDGRLVKTDHKFTGPYGRPEHAWQLADTHNEEKQ